MKPIIFSGDMVRALLREDNPKTQTRRVIKPQPPHNYFALPSGTKELPFWQWIERERDDDMMGWFPSYDEGLMPRYKRGDILYVRETWCYHANAATPWYGYKAAGDYRDLDLCWKSPIFMPRAAARIILRATGVRCERLQDITTDDCIAEGVEVVGMVHGDYRNYHCPMATCASAKISYSTLWNSLNAKRDNGAYSWENNPWVWVYEFERTVKP